MSWQVTPLGFLPQQREVTTSPAKDRWHRHLPLHKCLLTRGTIGTLVGGGLFNCWGQVEPQNVTMGGTVEPPSQQQRRHRQRLDNWDDNRHRQGLLHRPPCHLVMEKLCQEMGEFSAWVEWRFHYGFLHVFSRTVSGGKKNLSIVRPVK